MANTIRIKRRTAGSPGAPSSLENAELAYNEVDNTLYYGQGTGGSGGSATTIIPIAGPGAFLNLTGTQTVTGNKEFSGDIVFSGSVDFDNIIISGVADPVGPNDAANKAYVDANIQGLDIKESVRVASPDATNINIASAPSAIDGITLTSGDRVLLKAQTTASQNGIYVFNGSGSAMTRSADANTSAKVTGGMFTFVTEGTDHHDQGFVLSTNDPITLGTTALTFTQFSGAGSLEAGDGLTRSGNTINVVTASSSRIVVGTDSIDLATTGISASTYKSVTVDVYGRITAGSNPTTLSGYGITDATPSNRVITTQNGITGGGDLTSNRTLELTGQARALHDLATNGLVVRTTANTFAARTITGTANRVTVTDGNGGTGNPTIDIASTYAGQNTITTLGTIVTGTWNGTAIGLAYGGTGADLSAETNGAIFKKSGSSFVAAVEGTDYLSANSIVNGGTF